MTTKQSALEILGALDVGEIDEQIQQKQAELDSLVAEKQKEIDALSILRKAADMRVNGKPPRAKYGEGKAAQRKREPAHEPEPAPTVPRGPGRPPSLDTAIRQYISVAGPSTAGAIAGGIGHQPREVLEHVKNSGKFVCDTTGKWEPK